MSNRLGDNPKSNYAADKDHNHYPSENGFEESTSHHYLYAYHSDECLRKWNIQIASKKDVKNNSEAVNDTIYEFLWDLIGFPSKNFYL